MKLFKRLKCEHEYITISNFGGDYIQWMSPTWSNKIYRSRIMCTKCGKQKLSGKLDKDCKIINDQY